MASILVRLASYLSVLHHPHGSALSHITLPAKALSLVLTNFLFCISVTRLLLDWRYTILLLPPFLAMHSSSGSDVFATAEHGFIDSLKLSIIRYFNAHIVRNHSDYSFLIDRPCPDTANPKPWRLSCSPENSLVESAKRSLSCLGRVEEIIRHCDEACTLILSNGALIHRARQITTVGMFATEELNKEPKNGRGDPSCMGRLLSVI